MPQNTIIYFKKYLRVVDEKIERIGSLTRKAVSSGNATIPGLIHQFSELYHLAGFLNLTTMARMAYLGGQLVSRRAAAAKGLSKGDKSLLLTLIKQIHRLQEGVVQPGSTGTFVTPGGRLGRPGEGDAKALRWVAGLFRREGVQLPERFPIRPLRLTRSSPGGELLPPASLSQILRREKGRLSLAYVDLTAFSDPLELIGRLRSWKSKGLLKFHGPLTLPSAGEEGARLPYYFILRTPGDPGEFWRREPLAVRFLLDLTEPGKAAPPARKKPSRPPETAETPHAEKPTEELPAEAPAPETAPPPSERILEEETLLFDPASAPVLEAVDFLRPEPSLSAAAEEPSSEEEEPEETHREKRQKPEPGTVVRYPIGMKMSLITSSVLVIALSGMIFLASFFFLRDSRVRVEESNLKLSETIASQAEESLLQLSNAASLLLLGAGGGTTPEERSYRSFFFRNERNILAAGLPGEDRLFFNESLMGELGISEEYIRGVLADSSEPVRLARGGTPSVFNVSAYFGTPILGLTVPYKQERGIKTLFILTDTRQTLQKAVQSRGITDTFIVDSRGDLIAHPDATQVVSGINLESLPIVQELFSSAVSNGQIRFEQEPGRFALGSYKKMPLGRLGVVTTVSEDDAFEAIYIIQRRNILLMIMFVALAVLIIYYYSKTLSHPVRRLVEATRKVEKGEYDLNLVPKSQDEIGVLTRAFDNMGMGLEEKERIKDAFGRFVNKEMADMAEKGEIQLGGEIKPTTVFFSDIRSFTAISEKLTPSEVVSFLNEYMTLMVECVNRTHGVVDKYIGDAIMAVWGTPLSHGNDAENAVDGALQMRTALRRFNLGRGGERKPVIKVGCGLNSGDVLAGQIGSNERMEYTVIGDAVNLASRIEALNKPMGTDILISQGTADLVEGLYDLVPMNKIKVKGKAEPQQIYAVLGRLDDPDRPRSLKELRDRVGIEGDFDNIAEVNTEKEEVKYEIMD